MPVPKSVQEYVSEAKGGFVSIVVLPRHVKESTLDEFVWTLLSFHDHVQYHVKCFKVSVSGSDYFCHDSCFSTTDTFAMLM